MRKLSYVLLISVFLLAACAPRSFTEKDLANVKLTQKDLPPEFVQGPDSDIQNLAPSTAGLQKAFFAGPATGKIINTTLFSKSTSNASYGIISFNYFPLSAAEKQEVLTITKKQDLATCCKMLISILQADETSCAKSELTSLIAVLPGLDKIAEASLGCSLTITGDSYFELGYAVNQNVISVIFEGFNQVNPDDKITSVLDLKTMLTLINGKLPATTK